MSEAWKREQQMLNAIKLLSLELESFQRKYEEQERELAAFREAFAQMAKALLPLMGTKI